MCTYGNCNSNVGIEKKKKNNNNDGDDDDDNNINNGLFIMDKLRRARVTVSDPSCKQHVFRCVRATGVFSRAIPRR